MNEDLRFDRVYLRRDVWPLIEKRWPGAAIALSRSRAACWRRRSSCWTRAAACGRGRLRDGEALSVPGLRALGRAKRINAVRFWLSEAGVEAPSDGAPDRGAAANIRGGGGSQPAIVWGDRALRRYRQRMFVTDAEPPQLEGARHWPWSPARRSSLGPSWEI